MLQEKKQKKASKIFANKMSHHNFKKYIFHLSWFATLCVIGFSNFRIFLREQQEKNQ